MRAASISEQTRRGNDQTLPAQNNNGAGRLARAKNSCKPTDAVVSVQ
jgi:hypothetical protein